MESKITAPLRIFVYGSLKRGYRNHTAFCQGYESFRLATVVGRLHRQADGYPMLVVPQQSILALGTSDIPGDIGRLAQFEDSLRSPAPPDAENIPADAEDCQWGEIRGEIYEWRADNSESSKILARLDRLEDFYPPGSDKSSIYHRVILLARHDAGVEPVWTYVAPQGELPPGCAPMGLSWP